jgi:propanol-preferring alcohol dehydrogenase
MQAMVLTKQQAVEDAPLALREVNEPQAGPGEVRVKVSVCAVCRTDIHIAEGDLELHKQAVIPGHQIVGRVDQIGEGVQRLRLGERIGIGFWRTRLLP